MSDFLVIAGIAVPVAVTGAAQKASEFKGSDSRTYDFSLRSTIQAEKRVWGFTTKLMLLADAATLRAACANGTHVDCSGDALGGVTVNCRVTIGDAPYTKVAGGFKVALPLTLRET